MAGVRRRIRLWVVLVGVSAAGCGVIPMPEWPEPPLPQPRCGPVPGSGEGFHLTCAAAVAAAVPLLPDDHPAVETIRFEYGMCALPPRDTTVDCATQMVGVVTFEFAGGVGRPLRVWTRWDDRAVEAVIIPGDLDSPG